jgi:3-oxoacyl-[acyl-carrier-protein] synthase II
MMARSEAERIVVTGIGVVSPIGIGRSAFWRNLVEGRSGVGLLTAFSGETLPSPLAAEIRDFDPTKWLYNPKFVKVMSRDVQLGVSSASLAMKDAGLAAGDVEPERLGVDFGCGRISTRPEDLVEAVRETLDGNRAFAATRWGEDGLGKVTPLWLLKRLPNMPACHVSMEFDAQGPNNTITSRDSSALLALDEAVRTIERGAADVMIAGACGSSIHPVDFAKMSLFEDLSSRVDDPEHALRPFDRDRDGTIIGEGAGAFVVERYSHAVRRGADIYCEILAVGAGCDGKGYTNGAGGTGLVRSIESALRLAQVDPRQIGHINANGKSTQRDDTVEARAFQKVLGEAAGTIPVTALKSYFGHCDAGSGAIELAGSLLALRHGELPMTLNYKSPDPGCRLNVVREGPLPLKNRTALTVNRTAIGQSAAAIVRAV